MMHHTLFAVAIASLLCQRSHALRWAGDSVENRHSTETGNCASSSKYNPVLLVPGTLNTQLKVKLSSINSLSATCRAQIPGNEAIFWQNDSLVANNPDCFEQITQLDYDKFTETTRDATSGVRVSAVDFGLVEPVAYSGPKHEPDTVNFAPLIRELEQYNGLVPDCSIVGAGFDWRTVTENGQYSRRVTNLAETLSARNGGRPVTMICHSVGCPMILQVLNEQSQAWKDKYVKRVISISGSIEGHISVLTNILFGFQFRQDNLDKTRLRQLLRGFPNFYYRLIREPALSSNYVIVETPTRNYTLGEMDELMQAIGLTQNQLSLFRDTRNYAGKLRAPNVELWCLHGDKLPTPGKVVFNEPQSANSIDVDSDHTVINTDGDSLVIIESLRACGRFASQQSQPVHTRTFNKISHMDLVYNSRSIDYITREAMAGDLSE